MQRKSKAKNASAKMNVSLMRERLTRLDDEPELEPCDCSIQLKKKSGKLVLKLTGDSWDPNTQQFTETYKPVFTVEPKCTGDDCKTPEITYEWQLQKIEGTVQIWGETDHEEVLVGGKADCKYKMTLTVKVKCDKTVKGHRHHHVPSECEDSGSVTYDFTIV